MRKSVAVEAALLTRAVRIPGPSVICVVRPLTLNLPLRAIAERDQRNVEGPRTLVAVLLTALVVPRPGRIWIGAGLGKLVSAHIGQSYQPLRMQSRRILRVAASIAIEIEEEGDLNRHALARSKSVVRAVSGVASLYVDVPGLVSV